MNRKRNGTSKSKRAPSSVKTAMKAITSEKTRAMPLKTIVNGLMADQHRPALVMGPSTASETGEEVERAHPLEAYRAELPVALEQVDPHHLRVKRCTGDVAKRRLLADAEGVTRENAPTVHVDTRDAQQGPDSHTRERHGMTEPHKFVVPLAQRDALPDVDTQHEQFERDGAAGDDRADGCGHAHREAIEAVRCLAALARAAAGDPCSERADDEHGHTDAQNGFEQITHRGHRLGLWRLTAGNAARTMGCAQRKEPRIGKRRHRNRPANR